MDSYSVKKSRRLRRDDESLPLKIKEIKVVILEYVILLGKFFFK